MTYEEQLKTFLALPSQQIPIQDVRLSTALQPREARLVPVRDKRRSEESSAQHISTLRQVLEASQEAQLEPVLLAELESPPMQKASGLYLVDGHHRLEAYRQAKRLTLPARVLSLDTRTAVILAKIANCSGRSLAMHREQCREAAWQYLADTTQRGSTDLSQKDSLRSVASRFGISKNTVSSMLEHIRKVELKEFHINSLDAGTGWPRWRYVRTAANPWQTSVQMSQNERLEKDAERLAKQIVKIIDSSSREARARALEMIANDEVAAEDQLESVEFLSHFSPHPHEALPGRSVPIGTSTVPSQLAHLDS